MSYIQKQQYVQPFVAVNLPHPHKGVMVLLQAPVLLLLKILSLSQEKLDMVGTHQLPEQSRMQKES